MTRIARIVCLYHSPSGATGEPFSQKIIWADTYTQLYIHIVFAIKGRQSLIPKHHKEALHQYVTRIITNKKRTVIRINSIPDYIHILVGLTPGVSASDLVRDSKANSSKLINRPRWIAGRFEWQTGFAAFSYAHSQLDTVARYIKNQEAHRSHQTFREEYLGLLNRFDFPYNPKDDTPVTPLGLRIVHVSRHFPAIVPAVQKFNQKKFVSPDIYHRG